MKKILKIDSLPESASRYRNGWTVVAIDVIRATTMAVTATASGRRCYPVATIQTAFELSRELDNPLLAGEVGGDMPAGFDLNNSPAKLSLRTDVERPLVMLSSSGTRLIVNAEGCDTLYLGCFRNSLSTAAHIIDAEHGKVALIGAGSRNQFREEDQIACAWIAAELVRAGYVAEDKQTLAVVERWGKAGPAECLISESVDYLRKTGQEDDLDFILERIDDLEEAYVCSHNEIVKAVRAAPGIPPVLIPDLSISFT